MIVSTTSFGHHTIFTPVQVLEHRCELVPRDNIDIRDSLNRFRLSPPRGHPVLPGTWRTAALPESVVFNRHLFSQELNQLGWQRFFPRKRAATHKILGEQLLAIVYGIDVEPENDLFVALAEQAIQTVATAGIPGKYLVKLLHLPMEDSPFDTDRDFPQRGSSTSSALSSSSQREPVQ
ncbi:hypothetical protein C8R43DRAFT_1133193 [Mycena crocata]|nr:hypothetical protein C8R43DRAFT_1133193 [Mycena crocata]